MQRRMQEILYFLQYAIDEYGEAKTKPETVNIEPVVFDYVIFFVARSARSIDALDYLLTKGLAEDALVISRCVYENYLNIAFIANNPKRINELVAAKIGAYIGTLRRPKSKAGKTIWNKIIYPNDEIMPLGISVLEMSKETGVHADQEMHSLLYSFLSEFSHGHFVTLESYVDESKNFFTYAPRDINSYQAILYGLLVSWLILESLRNTQFLDAEDAFEAEELAACASELLINNVSTCGYEDPVKDLKKYLVARLEYQHA